MSHAPDQHPIPALPTEALLPLVLLFENAAYNVRTPGVVDDFYMNAQEDFLRQYPRLPLLPKRTEKEFAMAAQVASALLSFMAEVTKAYLGQPHDLPAGDIKVMERVIAKEKSQTLKEAYDDVTLGGVDKFYHFAMLAHIHNYFADKATGFEAQEDEAVAASMTRDNMASEPDKIGAHYASGVIGAMHKVFAGLCAGQSLAAAVKEWGLADLCKPPKARRAEPKKKPPRRKDFH